MILSRAFRVAGAMRQRIGRVEISVGRNTYTETLNQLATKPTAE